MADPFEDIRGWHRRFDPSNGSTRLYCIDDVARLLSALDALMDVGRSASPFSYVGPANDNMGNALDDYVIIPLERANKIQDALNALPPKIREALENA